jgi:peptide/nickel transport system substrate-binding protein
MKQASGPLWWSILTAGLLGAAAMLPLAAHAVSFTCPKLSPQLVFAMEAEPTGTDMHFSTAVSTRELTMNVMETLITRAENNDIIPDLAESYTESPDHLTYTFKLRPGIVFHNGQKLTSADVLASFQRYAKIAPNSLMLKPVATMSAPDPMALVQTPGPDLVFWLGELGEGRQWIS